LEEISDFSDIYKNRNAPESFEIIVTTDGTLTQFSTLQKQISPLWFLEIAKFTLEKSAKQWWYPFLFIEKTSTLTNKIHPQWAMIFVFSNSLERRKIEYLKGLSSVNDVIFIHTFHPFEISADESILFEYWTINTKKYQKEWKEKQKDIESYTKSLWCWYILFNTHESISEKMNIFLKIDIVVDKLII